MKQTTCTTDLNTPASPRVPVFVWLSPVRFLWGSHVSPWSWIAVVHNEIPAFSAGGPTETQTSEPGGPPYLSVRKFLWILQVL